MSTHTAAGSPPPPDPHTHRSEPARLPPPIPRHLQAFAGTVAREVPVPLPPPPAALDGAFTAPVSREPSRMFPPQCGPAEPTLHKTDPRIILYLFGPRPPELSCSREQTCLTCFDPQSLAQGPAATAQAREGGEQRGEGWPPRGPPRPRLRPAPQHLGSTRRGSESGLKAHTPFPAAPLSSQAVMVKETPFQDGGHNTSLPLIRRAVTWSKGRQCHRLQPPATHPITSLQAGCRQPRNL